jgi:hypothetical protein
MAWQNAVSQFRFDVSNKPDALRVAAFGLRAVQQTTIIRADP